MRGMIVGLMMGLVGLAAPAAADTFLEDEWLLNSASSRIYMGTVKANAIFETHHFSSIDGSVKPNGDVEIKIELGSLETGIDIRNVRMRFLLFETFRFPIARITAKLDKDRLADLENRTRIAYPLRFTLEMHGVRKDMEALVWVTRISEKVVTVSSVQPVIVTADEFGLEANVGKLMDAVEGTPIAPGASITFDLMFAAGNLKPEIEADRAVRVKRSLDEANAAMDREGCENRFATISRTGALHFRSGSAELDQRESEPLLAAILDVARRCPGVQVDIAGHTDSDGSPQANRRLSEQRAQVVMQELVRRGADQARIRAFGFGDTRPVAANDGPVNKAKNRRIEFVVRKS